MNTKKIVFIVVIVLIVGFIGWKLFANKSVVDARQDVVEVVSFAIPVKTAKASMENISKEQAHTGTFEANETSSLIAETQGSVRAISVSEGDRVSKGQVILKVDDASLQAQHTSAKANLENAKKDLERFQKLEASGAVSKQQIEDKALAVKTSEANLESINQQLRFTFVKSAITGYVNEVFVEEGEFVMPGTKVAEVINIAKLKLVLNVSETDLGILKEGKKMTIETDVYKLKSFTGVIEHISYKADESKKYRVSILVSNDSKNPLRAGMFGKATFASVTGGVENLTIPRRAIVGSLKDAQVYVVNGNKVTLKSITVGTTLNDSVVVLEGLQAGEEVVTNGQINLTNGVEVRIVNQ